MARKITALPSVIVVQDGTEKELISCSPEERENWNTKLCHRISTAMREQYTDKIEEWNNFAAKMVL